MTHRIVRRSARDKAVLVLPADCAAVIVVVPAGSTLTREGRRTRVDGVVVDWRSGG